MSLVLKIIFLIGFFATSTHLVAREVHVLVVGDSGAADCSQNRYPPSPGVFQVALTGQIRSAFDPFEWSDCDGGSIWMPLGEKMLLSGFATSVVFMPVGFSGARVDDWIEGGRAFTKLERAMRVAKNKNISFDYALWHPGSSDFGAKPESYTRNVNELLLRIYRNVNVKKWIFARHTRCGGLEDYKVDEAQKKLGRNFHLSRYPGPDVNKLIETYSTDGCHLNKKGQEVMAEFWLESLVNADKVNSWVRAETLLEAFSFGRDK